MSGIEVAGLVLGALPVLIEAIDTYRKGITKVKSAIKKRVIIGKLGRALSDQKFIIEAIARDVLVRSGCDDAEGADDAQLRSLLQDKQTQGMVDSFLGPDYAQKFLEALVDCRSHINHATTRLALLIPELANVKSHVNVEAILQANAASEKGQIQFLARLSIALNLEDLEREIAALDRCTNFLYRFTRVVTTCYQPGQSIPSRKAAKLARVLQIVRQNAVSLHSALTRQWVAPCHQHELKIFLEHRIPGPKFRQATTNAQASCFQVVFAGDTTQAAIFWHETLFHVEADNSQTAVNAPPAQAHHVQFAVPQPRIQPTNPRFDVPDICVAISDALWTAQHPMFHLVSTRNITVSLHPQTAATTRNRQTWSTTLQQIFQDCHSRTAPCSSLPWKWRMILALNIASSFLQFIRTPWVQPSWSSSNIHIPYSPGGQGLDLSRPFISADFRGNAPPPANIQAQVMDDLLDLGILLLEIWHENNLETQFAQHLSTNNVTFMRRACALQWLEDLQNPMPDRYLDAVSHCVRGLTIFNTRAPEWDNTEVWKAVCENVIEQLAKVAFI